MGKFGSKHKLRLIAVLSTVWLALGFTNCTRSIDTSELPLSNVLESVTSVDYNGSGHSGKLSFARYLATPLCSSAQGPDEKIEVDGSTATRTVSQCQSNASGAIAIADLQMNPYNSNYLVYNDDVFVNQTVLPKAAPYERHLVYAFCSAPSYRNVERGTQGLDIAIRVDQVWNGQWETSSFANIIEGKPNQASTESMQAGRLRDPGPGEVTLSFVGNQGLHLRFVEMTSAKRAKAILSGLDVNDLNIDCYLLKD